MCVFGNPPESYHFFSKFITWLSQKGVTLHTRLFEGNLRDSFKSGYYMYICKYNIYHIYMYIL